MGTYMRAITTLTALAGLLSLSLSACGDSENLVQAAGVLSEHYTAHPPPHGWTVEAVNPERDTDKLVVEVLISSDADIQRIKMLSRMEQFTVAKLACPEMTPALRTAIGAKVRVWVQLKTAKEILTASICPE